MNKTAALNIAERTVATYLETCLGLLHASTTVLGLGVLRPLRSQRFPPR